MIAARVFRRSAGRHLAAALAFAALVVAGNLATGGAYPAFAQSAAAGVANLNVTPRRVIFTRGNATAAVYVFNRGTSPLMVDIALVDNVMLPTGEILTPDAAIQRNATTETVVRRLNGATEFILATPSRVTLPAGGGKTVRLRADVPSDGPPREYRTHLTVTSVPPQSAGLTAEDAAQMGSNELRMQVQTVFGISIPLIIRTGDPSVAASFGVISFAEDEPRSGETGKRPMLVVPIERSGERSLFGNLEVRTGSGKDAELVGLVRGVGVYPEIDQRVVRVPLARRPQTGESMTISFVDAEGNDAQPLAAESFIMP